MRIRNDKREDKYENLKLHSRDTKNYYIKVRKNGVLQNITDWTLYFTVKENISDDDSEAVINKKVTSHSDPTNGESLIELIASDTDLVGDYWYSLDYKDEEDNEGTLKWGKIQFEQSIRKLRD